LHNKHNSIQNMLLLTIGEFSFNSTVDVKEIRLYL
jgi:hypothetical protein